jgi:beta-barrel assembly-enhancing protease
MYRQARTTRGRQGGGCLNLGRLGMAAVIAISTIVMYLASSEDNPVTGQTQYVSLSVDQEIALGLQAAPELAQQFGGLDPDRQAAALVEEIGQRLVRSSPASNSPYEYDFHLLADSQTINAFALPGGQIFITRALFDQLETEAELAGVLGHEIGHVVGRHSAEQIAKAKLTEGLAGAAVIATYDPQNPSSAAGAQIAAVIGQIINMRWGREHELESDFLGVCFLDDAGYDPAALIRVMQVLAGSREGPSPPEFFSTHPNPDNRIQRIEEAIRNLDRCPGR